MKKSTKHEIYVRDYADAKTLLCKAILVLYWVGGFLRLLMSDTDESKMAAIL